MMRVVVVLLAVLLIVCLAGSKTQVHAQAGCLGPKPPQVPLQPGCKSMRVECLCGSNGQDCHWEWVCVK